MDFDELADDLDVPDEVREKVRARGPEAPPMWVDAYERIKAQKAAGIAPAATPTPASPNAKAPPTAPPAGSPKLNLLDGSRPAESKPGEMPKLSALLKRPGAK